MLLNNIINQPIIFSPKFFKDKKMDADIENYVIDNEVSLNILNKRDYWMLLYG